MHIRLRPEYTKGEEEDKVGAVLEKPSITQDQMVPASTAARDFRAMRKKAQDMPLFILERGRIDAVLLGYDQYERMYMRLRELETELLVQQRSQELHDNPGIAVPWREVRRTGGK